MTLTEIIDQLNEWTIDTQSDLTKDWNEEKAEMSAQLQLLLQAKSNLELLKQTGNQIFKSSIKK